MVFEGIDLKIGSVYNQFQDGLEYLLVWKWLLFKLQSKGFS